MTNNNTQLPVEVLKKIDSDANDYLGLKEVEFSQRSFNAYAAGATEWAIWKAKHDDLQKQLQAQDANVEILLDRIRQLKDKAEKMEAALREIIKDIGSLADGDIFEIASKALQQWNDREKEITDPCPNCGKELSRDRNLCCRECGKEVERAEHNISIGDHINYCHECGFPVDECNCEGKEVEGELPRL